MKTLKIILLIVAFLAMVFIPQMSFSKKKQPIEQISTALAIVEPANMDIDEMIEYVAPRWQQDPALISKISYCESKHEEVEHDGGHGFGVAGIHKLTFEKWLPVYEEENHETLDYDSSFDQIKMMTWAFSKGNSYRKQWTTYVAYINGGTYSFYSKLLKENFTVYCK